VNISIKEPQVINTNYSVSTQVATQSISGFFYPIARIRPNSYTDDFMPSVFESTDGFSAGASLYVLFQALNLSFLLLILNQLRRFTEPPWSPTAASAPNLLLPGRTYYLYAVASKQGAVNVSTLFMPVVHTSVIRSSDGPKPYWLQPYKIYHMGIEFDQRVDGKDSSYFQLNSSRALSDSESIGYIFGAVAWGERGGQGGGILYSQIRSMTRENSQCSVDVNGRTYLSFYFYPRPVMSILNSNSKPLAPVTLEVVPRLATLTDVRAGETASVVKQYSTVKYACRAMF
jgi:hypothetical protein